jgi:hypothetical protein
MPDQFSVLTTPAFERDFRKLSKGNPKLISALEDLIAILGQDPYNQRGQHNIKKLVAVKSGEGSGEYVGVNTVCAMTSLRRRSSCTHFATAKMLTSRG